MSDSEQKEITREEAMLAEFNQQKTEQEGIIRQGARKWNEWRKEHQDQQLRLAWTDLSEIDLTMEQDPKRKPRRADLRGIDLCGTKFRRANLSWVDFTGADLRGVDLSGAKLKRALLENVKLDAYMLIPSDGPGPLTNARGADFRGADLRHSLIWLADFRDADLRGADLRGAHIEEVDLRGANLAGADLQATMLLKSDLSNADLTGAKIYGISAWGIKKEGLTQSGLIITPRDQPPITVDDFEVAQFVYLLLTNHKIRDVITTITSKTVLILGRFTDERKAALELIANELRKRDMVPIIFDWLPSENRDLTETVHLLADMARFVIADVTDANSIPQELSAIIPSLPSVPIQPIILAGQRPYAMFEHWTQFTSVLPEFSYDDLAHIRENIEHRLLQPVIAWEGAHEKQRAVSQQLKEQQAEIAALKKELAKSRADQSD